MLNSKKQLSDNQLENVVGGKDFNFSVDGKSLSVFALIYAAVSFVYGVANTAYLMVRHNETDDNYSYYCVLPKGKNYSLIGRLEDQVAYKLLQTKLGGKVFGLKKDN